MSITTRFSVGIHILALLEVYKEEVNSSNFIASSVNTNPALIRKITGLLKQAGLVNVRAGVAGAHLAKEPKNIQLLEVYEAVNADKPQDLFDVHQNTNEDCLVGKHIQEAIDPILHQVEDALKAELKGLTIEDVVQAIRKQEEKS